MNNTYLDCLALFGIGGAHPGGLQLTKQLISTENIDQKTAILDTGCGTGQSSAYLAGKFGCHIISIDSNEMMIKKAKQRFTALQLPIQAMVANTEKLPFADDTFDFILSESVIVFTNLAKTLTEFKRVLKPDGRLLAIEMVLETSLNESEMGEIKDFYQISRLLTETEWTEEFKNAGFKKILCERNWQKSNLLNSENAPDFAPSENIQHEIFYILEKHEELTKKYQKNLGYRIFRCL